MEITAEVVKQLRDATGAGMMDCKKALVKANGDFAQAEKLTNGLPPSPTSGRATNMSFIHVAKDKAGRLKLIARPTRARNQDHCLR